MMTTDALALPVTPSRAVAAKALAVPVRVNSNGAYVVASGSEPGKTYIVQSHGGGPLSCDCAHGAPCSHVYAAMAHADPAVRRALLARVRPARRMGRDAAEALVERFLRAALATDELETRAFANGQRATQRAAEESRDRRERIADKLVARLTGNDDGDE